MPIFEIKITVDTTKEKLKPAVKSTDSLAHYLAFGGFDTAVISGWSELKGPVKS